MSGKYRRVRPPTYLRESMIAWADVVTGRFAFRVVKPEDRKPDPAATYQPEEGNDVYLQVPTGGGFYESLDLTKLTATELEYVEYICLRAIAAAKPIVKERDAVAAAANTELLHARLYHQLPQLVDRERDVRQHG